MTELVIWVTRAKTLKSRNCETWYGLMKLSCGARSQSSGVMSAFHDSLRITNPTIMTKIG